METFTLEAIKEDQTFRGDLCIDSNFILLPESCPVTKDLLEELKEWEFTSLITQEALSREGKPAAPESVFNTEPKQEEPQAAQTPQTENTIDNVNNTSFNDNSTTNVKIGESVKIAIENYKNVPVETSDNTRMEMVQKVYDEYMNYIEKMFTFYATNKQINLEELSDTVKELCMFIKDHRRYILRINPSSDNSSKNFLIMHSMRTTVIAIVIAMQMHIPLSKMVELGVTCVLHEIGMLKLPPQVYMTSRQLTPGEKVQILKHPLFGYAIAKDMNFPLAIQLGILEHHEKENGTGYPRRLTSDKISINAKIISVACSYEAITAPRTYKDERSAFVAILELLKNNNHQYDDDVIKALLLSVSLFPIGSYVYLSNRKVALVIDSNPDSPKFPIVQSLSEKEDNGSPKIIQTSADGVSIVRILTKEEQKDILKILDERYAAIKEAQEFAEANPLPAKKEPVPEQVEEMIKQTAGSMEEVDISLFS